MNERMLEIKALNLILSLLYLLIISLVKPLHIVVHSAVDAQEIRPPHVTLYKIHLFKTC